MEKLLIGIVASVLILVVAAVLAVPLAFFLMLFIGNLGVNVSFWGALPGAFALGSIIRPTTATTTAS